MHASKLAKLAKMAKLTKVIKVMTFWGCPHPLAARPGGRPVAGTRSAGDRRRGEW